MEKQKQHKSKSKPDKEICNKGQTAKTNTLSSEPEHQNPKPKKASNEPLVYSPQHKTERQKLGKIQHGSVMQSTRFKAHNPKSEMHRTKHEGDRSKPKAQKPTKLNRLDFETGKQTATNIAKQKSDMTALKSRGEGGRQDGRGMGQDVRLNEIEATAISFKKDNYNKISMSIYDPRPRTRSYKKHNIRKGKGPGRGPKAYKGNLQNRSSNNHNLSIRKSMGKNYPTGKSTYKIKNIQKKSNFES